MRSFCSCKSHDVLSAIVLSLGDLPRDKLEQMSRAADSSANTYCMVLNLHSLKNEAQVARGLMPLMTDIMAATRLGVSDISASI